MTHVEFCSCPDCCPKDSPPWCCPSCLKGEDNTGHFNCNPEAYRRWLQEHEGDADV